MPPGRPRDMLPSPSHIIHHGLRDYFQPNPRENERRSSSPLSLCNPSPPVSRLRHLKLYREAGRRQPIFSQSLYRLARNKESLVYISVQEVKVLFLNMFQEL